MNFAGEKVLVTGGCGFIGSHIVERLVKQNAEVIVVDNCSTGSLRNIHNFKDSITVSQFNLIEVKQRINDIKEDLNYVFHLAANSSVPRSSLDPLFDFNNNVLATVELLNVLRKLKSLKHVVFASSAAVYGSSEMKKSTEKDIPLPSSPYGVSKLCSEHYGNIFHSLYGIPWTNLRLYNVYGPRMSQFVIFDILSKLKKTKKHEPLHLLGTGNELRHYCYIDDAVDGFLNVALHPNTIGETFNLAGNRPLQIKDLARLILEIKGQKREVLFSTESWQGDQSTMWADFSKLSNLISYSPNISLEDGLVQVSAWHDAVFGE